MTSHPPDRETFIEYDTVVYLHGAGALHWTGESASARLDALRVRRRVLVITRRRDARSTSVGRFHNAVLLTISAETPPLP